MHGGSVTGGSNYGSVIQNVTGCFSAGGIWKYFHAADLGGSPVNSVSSVAFNASNHWTGTSESIGSDTAFNILPPYKVAYCFRRLS